MSQIDFHVHWAILVIAVFLGAPLFLFLCAKWLFAGYYRAKERHQVKEQKINGHIYEKQR